MEFKLEPMGNIMVMTIPGEILDAGNSQEFKSDIAPILAEHKRVVFDMSEMNFVDSSGCGALLSCLRTLRADNGDLKLCRISPQVQELFKLIRMDRIFHILEKREDAVEAFSKK
jgi:anti-sigma B factor antagonist